MIKKIKKEDELLLKKLLTEDKFQNVYLYIDAMLYGFNSDIVKTFIVGDDSKIKLVLYHYYNSLQIFEKSELTVQELNDVCDHIVNYSFNMISGNINIIEKIRNKLSKLYKIEYGYIMKKNEKIDKCSNLSQIAKDNDYNEICKLICSDESIGGHYTLDGLKEQLLERKNNRNCKNLIIKDDNKIVAHVATYADINDVAVIGGLITDYNYRHRGYGKIILNDLTKILKEEEKTPVLYCYSERLVNWYLSQGWQVITKCAKLEKIKKD